MNLRLPLPAILLTFASVAQAAVLTPLTQYAVDDPNLKAWFRADNGVVHAGASVTGWTDQSLSIPSVSRDLTGTGTYLASEATLNGLPTVGFDGVSQYLARPTGNSPVTGNSDRTTFAIITNRVATASNGEHVLHFGNSSTDQAYGILVRASTNIGNHYWSGFDPGTTAPTSNPTQIMFAYDGDGGGATGIDSYFVNGATAGSFTPSTVGGVLATGTSTFTVGSRAAPYAEGINAQVGEIIVYDRLLNRAEQTIVQNYLSSKYNVPLNTGGGAADVYAGDTNLNGDYDSDVFGVGRVDSSNQFTDGAKLGLQLTAGPLDDGEWLMAGHDGTSNGIVSIESSNPLVSGTRWARAWYLDKTGVLDATISFDFEDAGLTAPVAGSTYSLLYQRR